MDLVFGAILTPIEAHMAIKKDILIGCFRGVIREIFFRQTRPSEAAVSGRLAGIINKAIEIGGFFCSSMS
jgi:hypothetical protein